MALFAKSWLHTSGLGWPEEMHMNEMSSTEAKTHFGALLDMAQREPVTIHKKGRAVAVMLSMQDFEEHEAMKLKLLQQANER
jgi:prevent-host-death family protein